MPAHREEEFAVLCLCLLVALAGPPGTPLPSQLALLIEQLGDDSFEVREAAGKRLREAGEAAEPFLEKAIDSTDAEVKKRARAILADCKLGIYPGTPDAVVELARKYAAATGNEKRPIIQSLLDAGGPGVRVLGKLARAEADPIARKDVFTDISLGIGKAAPLLLASEDRKALETLLELGVQGDLNTGAAHYAAYLLLTGRAPAKIAAMEAKAKANPPGKVENEILYFLYRAMGDARKARDAAVKAERSELLEAILLESGDWKRLDKDPKLVPDGDWAMRKGFRAAYARLAGNTKENEKLVAEILEKARPLAREGGDVLPYAKALFFNARADDAINLLVGAKGDPRLLFHVLVARMRYKEAFAIVEQARRDGRSDAPILEMHQARTQWFLGQKDEAIALIKKAAGNLKAAAGASWPDELIETELAIGRRDEAFNHAATLIAVSKEDEWPARLFAKLFPGREKDARAVWLAVKETPGSTAERLGHLRMLFEGKAKPDDIRLAMKHAANPETWRGLGEAADLCGQDKLAAECFARGGQRGQVRLGDLLIKAKQYTKAAEQYESAFQEALKKHREIDADAGDDGIPSVSLYLSGKALVAAGKPTDGRACIERAHLLPLGDMGARHGFFKTLQKRGHKDGARREAELLARLGEPVLTNSGNFWTAEGVRALSVEKEKAGHEVKAADGFELVFLGCLTPNVNFTRSQAYVTVPSFMHKVRAVGLARAGKFVDAKVEAGRALACWPANLDLAIGLVPILEKGGRKDDAAQLYREVQAPQLALLKEYPRSPLALNQLAWLSACCKRDIDKAVKWAKQATDLSPETAAYHDTHAEALFQAGKKADAIVAIKKAVAIDPKRVYFQKMLKRLEKGDKAAPLPSDDEE